MSPCVNGASCCTLACALLPDDAGDAGVAACIADCDWTLSNHSAEWRLFSKGVADATPATAAP